MNPIRRVIGVQAIAILWRTVKTKIGVADSRETSPNSHEFGYAKIKPWWGTSVRRLARRLALIRRRSATAAAGIRGGIAIRIIVGPAIDGIAFTTDAQQGQSKERKQTSHNRSPG